MADEIASWEESAYGVEWASDDVLAPLLQLPRRISTALVRDSGIDVRRVADLGSGQGAYLELFLEAFPEAHGLWIDANEGMRGLAEERLASDRVEFFLGDVERLGELDLPPLDVLTTSRVLHHFSPESLQRIYRTAHQLLRPGGFLFNLDHVGAPGDWDSSYRRIRREFTGARSTTLRPHRENHPLPSAEAHLEWIAAAGFATPDVAWRTFYTVLLVARRPSSA